MELHSILKQMIHKENNPPNTTISLESNSEDTHSVVEIINVEKPDIKNPNKITLACKFLTEKIDLKKGYNNVDLTIDEFKLAKNLEAFDSLENNSMDLYASVRSLYLQDRKRKILNSDETTDTMNDDDWEEIDTQ